MDNPTIGLVLFDLATALAFYKLGGEWAAVGSLIGSAVYFSFIR